MYTAIKCYVLTDTNAHPSGRKRRFELENSEVVCFENLSGNVKIDKRLHSKAVTIHIKYEHLVFVFWDFERT